jgi:hypothetical protein
MAGSISILIEYEWSKRNVTMEESAADDVKTIQPVSQYPKQAVIVIHGIGEQIPMDTIRGFVRTVWETDSSVLDAQEAGAGDVWSRPDLRTGSLELRRITTRQSVTTLSFPKGVRTDFYEMYWADLSAGSTWDQIKSWILGLLIRNPFTRVPNDVLLAWIVLWIASVAVLFLAILSALPKEAKIGSLNLWTLPVLAWFADTQGWKLVVATALLGFVTNWFVVPYAGRVVRYTRATPENIAARKSIRERGLELLKQLHGGEYERIVVVGHSLGSILAYDLISYFWSTRTLARTVWEGKPEFDALLQLESAIDAVQSDEKPTKEAIANYRAKQAGLAGALRRRGKPDEKWLITDFVTLGSPLTHAEFLLAKSKRDLERRKSDREFPTCPPFREQLSQGDVAKAIAAGFRFPKEPPRLSCFPFAPGGWQMHHASPFAAVRWTNIYDPSSLILLGDIVSGPLQGVLGFGIDDVNLRDIRGPARWFTHTEYWSLASGEVNKPPAHIVELRKALDLPGRELI